MLKTNFLIIVSTLFGIACATSPTGDNSENDSGIEQINPDSAADTNLDENDHADTDSTSDTNTSQSDTSCDGENVDCYAECWQCARETHCEGTVNRCKTDAGCNTYLNCKESQCCPGGECLSEASLEDCMNNCLDIHNISYESFRLYNKIDHCVSCDACAISCAQNEADDFAYCARDYTTMPVCYAEQAADGKTGCYDWAGWVGPCRSQKEVCHEDTACTTLEICISDSWQSENWESIQTDCFATAGEEAETMYWAFVQCIYCDACDLFCASDAGSKRCGEYIPQN